jgi:tripartite-type tricarboxylate transporter receptor subunit TctC
VPTFSELGYPELVASTWFGFGGPAGLPDNIVTLLNREIKAILDEPDMRRRLETEGVTPEAMSAPQVARFVADEIAKWTPVARDHRQ